MQLIPIHEMNDCHEPSGPKGGQFCSKGGIDVSVLHFSSEPDLSVIEPRSPDKSIHRSGVKVGWFWEDDPEHSDGGGDYTPHKYRGVLRNVYDLKADPLKLKKHGEAPSLDIIRKHGFNGTIDENGAVQALVSVPVTKVKRPR